MIRVTFELDDDQVDVLDALAYVEGHAGRGSRGRMAREIVAERLDVTLRRDADIRELVTLRRDRRVHERGQLRLLRDTPAT